MDEVSPYLSRENIKVASGEEYKKCVSSEKFKEMHVFPAQDSVKIIDGVVVVKLSEEPGMP